MGFQYTLQKVLEVKEHEQAEAQANLMNRR